MTTLVLARRADDLPEYPSELIEVPALQSAWRQGRERTGRTSAPPAVVGAVLDAPRLLSIDHIDTPAVPAHVCAAIQKAGAMKQAAEYVR